MLPPSGFRRSWVHYGVMVPGLPEPQRFFNVMSILGTPGVALFNNDDLVTTTRRDTAYVVSATSTMTGGQFRAYPMRDQCEFAADGSYLRFGDDLVIEGAFPKFTLRRTHPEVDVVLDIEASDVVTHFVRLPGVYRHWSARSNVRGRVGDTDIATLGTVEYASGVSVPRRLNLPGRLFTYHVLNVDDEIQVLLSHVVGPAGLPVQRAVHVRTGERATAHRKGHRFVVHDYEPTPRTTPDGRTMRIPLTFSWGADDVIDVHGRTNGDFAYGLGAGYVGSYDYEGTFRGRTISGCAYMEYVDCR